MKNAMLLMLVGALLGAVAASFIVPPMLSWYTAPGGLPQGASIPALVQIPEVIRYATSRLLLGQSIGAGSAPSPAWPSASRSDAGRSRPRRHLLADSHFYLLTSNFYLPYLGFGAIPSFLSDAASVGSSSFPTG